MIALLLGLKVPFRLAFPLGLGLDTLIATLLIKLLS
jgi:hypothetical protein